MITTKTRRPPIAVSKWQWFGSAGDFICGSRCQFHLCTLVGQHLVSTVGELRLKQTDDEFEPLGAGGKNSLYETMVFKTDGTVCDSDECSCGLPSIITSELDSQRYAKAGDAAKGHYKFCRKWAKR